MGRYRSNEVFEGCRWLGSDTPKGDVEWLRSLPDGPSNVKTVEINGDVLAIETGLTRSQLLVGDYILIGKNKQPLVMPKDVFDRMYEEVPDAKA